MEDFQAANDILDHLLDGSHYQRQVDALREMGNSLGAERLRERLAVQGISTN